MEKYIFGSQQAFRVVKIYFIAHSNNDLYTEKIYIL